ncbi:MAG: FtsX-like permease family protein [Aureliella sp.]
MKTPLAILNLWHQGAKTLVSIGGVGFALLLVFMQLGFMGAVSHTATNVLDNLEFDVLIRARDYLHLYEPGTIDRRWLSSIEGVDGVSEAVPFWITVQNWRRMPTADDEPTEFSSQYLPIAVMAVQPGDPVFRIAEINQAADLLSTARSVVIDDSTQHEYGPWNGKSFGGEDIDRAPEIGGQAFTIQGVYSLGTGLAANGGVITSSDGYGQIMPWDPNRTVSLGLIQLDAPSQENREKAVDQIRSIVSLPTTLENETPTPTPSGVVDVLTKDEALQRERFRWLWQTPIGLIFQLGVVLSLMVGAAIVYMVLSTDVAHRLPEYATLLAMGYSRSYLASIVMTQALTLCGLGLMAAWLAAEGLYRVTTAISAIPLTMSPSRVGLVAVLGVAMCCVSGLLALRKLWKAEPASLF